MIGDRGEAEDLAQEVFVTVFKRIDGFRGESRLGTWLYRVATNHCRNRIKYLQRRARGSQRELDDAADRDAVESVSMSTSAQMPRPDELVHGYRVQRALEAALAALPDEQRELVLLRDVEGLSYEEIQEVTGLAEGTVKSRLHRARISLQHRIESLREGGT
jgi:RNA polymerase sigma-70 factor (ECF subfamily)